MAGLSRLDIQDVARGHYGKISRVNVLGHLADDQYDVTVTKHTTAGAHADVLLPVARGKITFTGGIELPRTPTAAYQAGTFGGTVSSTVLGRTIITLDTALLSTERSRVSVTVENTSTDATCPTTAVTIFSTTLVYIYTSELSGGTGPTHFDFSFAVWSG